MPDGNSSEAGERSREATSTGEVEGRPGGDGGLSLLVFSPFRLRQTEMNPDGHKVTSKVTFLESFCKPLKIKMVEARGVEPLS